MIRIFVGQNQGGFLQPKLKYLSPWIAWSVVALAGGILLFTIWYYYTNASTAWENSVLLGVMNHRASASAPTVTTQ